MTHRATALIRPIPELLSSQSKSYNTRRLVPSLQASAVEGRFLVKSKASALSGGQLILLRTYTGFLFPHGFIALPPDALRFSPLSLPLNHIGGTSPPELMDE